MPITEDIGFRAVIQNLTGYLGGINQINAANAKLVQAELRVQQVSQTSAAAQEAANARILNSERNLQTVIQATNAARIRSGQAIIAAQRNLQAVTLANTQRIEAAQTRVANAEEASARRIATAQARLEAANKALAASSVGTAAQQVRAANRVASAEINLENVTITAEQRIASARTALATATTSAASRQTAALAAVTKAQEGAARVAETATARQTAAEAALAAARINAASVAEQSAIRQQAAQIGLIAAGGRLLTSTGVLNTAYKAFTTIQGVAGAAVRRFGEALIAVTGFANRFAVSLRFGIGAITAFSAAFTIATASKFEQTLLRINNLTDATTQETAQFKDELLELSKTIPKSPDELGAGLYFILSSGIKDSAQAFDILELASKASVAGLGEVDAVTRLLTQTINAYGQENLTAAQAADILFATAREGSAEVDDLTSTLGRVTTPAAQLGIEFNELGASIAALTNAGLPASQAVTALLGIMNQLLDPSAEAKELLEDNGTSIQKLRQEVAEKGLIPAMKSLLETFNGNREVLTTLFPEIRGLVGIFALLSNESFLYDQALQGVNHSVGIVGSAFKEASKTFEFQANLIKNILNRALIQLGAEVLPKIVTAFRDVERFVNENRESIKEYLRIVELLVTRFFDGIVAIGRFAHEIGGAKGVIIAAVIAIGAVITAVVGPWVALFAGVAIAIGFLVEDFDKFRNKTIEIWNSLPAVIQVPLQVIAANIATFVHNAVEIFNNIVAGVQETVSLVKNIIDGDWAAVWEDAKDIAGIAVNTMIDTIQLLLGNLPNIFAHFGALAINAFVEAIEKGLESFAQIDLTNFLPPGLNIAAKEAAKVVGVDTTIGPNVDINLPKIPVPEIDLSSLPEFNRSLEQTNQSVRSVSEEVDNFGQQSLAQVQQQFNDTSLSVDDTTNALDKLKDRLSKVQAAFSEALSTTQEEADLLLSKARLELAKLTERPVSNEDRLSKQPTDAAGRPIVPFFATPEFLDPFGRTAQEAFDQQTKLQEDAIDKQLAVIEAQRGVWEAQAKVVDATLLTQQEQKAAVDRILGLIEQESENIRAIADASSDPLAILLPSLGEWNEQISEAAQAANSFAESVEKIVNIDTQSLLEQFERLGQQQFLADPQTQLDFISGTKTLQEAAQQIKDFFNGDISLDIRGPILQVFEDIKSFFTTGGFPKQNQITPPNVGDAGLKDQDNLVTEIITSIKETSDNVIKKIDDLMSVITDQLIIAFQDTVTSIESLTKAIVGEEGIKGLTDAIKDLAASIGAGEELPVVGQQHGGFTTKPTLTLRGEHSLPELTLPLREPARSRELLMSLPPSLAAQIMPGRQSPQINNLLGGVSVQGIVTPEIEHMVFREVRRQLSRPKAGLRAIGL